MQQHLPFTVLKLIWQQDSTESCTGCNSTYRLRYWNALRWQISVTNARLQQHLPFTVLKLNNSTSLNIDIIKDSCNSTYRLRYWNKKIEVDTAAIVKSCNSTYRLRYWNAIAKRLNCSRSSVLQQSLPFTVLKQIN